MAFDDQAVLAKFVYCSYISTIVKNKMMFALKKKSVWFFVEVSARFCATGLREAKTAGHK